MPLTAIDYSKTFIYKLCCKDPTITDIYIGHTTNVVKRRQQHKYSCNKDTKKDYNYYVYQFIRNNGGWDNFEMIVLVELNCKDKNEALREERKYLEELKATLNKQIPTRTYKEYRPIYTEQNKEKIAEQRKEYYEENKEIIVKQQQEYREQNRDKILEQKKAYAKKYREQNRDKCIEADRRYREKQKALKALSIN